MLSGRNVFLAMVALSRSHGHVHAVFMARLGNVGSQGGGLHGFFMRQGEFFMPLSWLIC